MSLRRGLETNYQWTIRLCYAECHFYKSVVHAIFCRKTVEEPDPEQVRKDLERLEMIRLKR